MEIRLQDALRHFNVGKGAWYGWKDTKDGEVYSNIKLLDETATMPTEEEINSKIVELQWEQNRKNDYPSIPDQLDDIFHNGIDGWKATIQETKDKYPKG